MSRARTARDLVATARQTAIHSQYSSHDRYFRFNNLKYRDTETPPPHEGRLSGLLASFLVGVRPFDPLTFVAASLFLAAVAAVASFLPAHRATRIDPFTALRSE